MAKTISEAEREAAIRERGPLALRDGWFLPSPICCGRRMARMAHNTGYDWCLALECRGCGAMIEGVAWPFADDAVAYASDLKALGFTIV